jgi:hypothetical protein
VLFPAFASNKRYRKEDAMPSELTLYTSDRRWMVDLDAWTSDLQFFKSIGTRVTVYHEGRQINIWGSRQTEWEEEAPALIRIRNVYSGSGPGVVTQEREWRNASRAELKQWSGGGAISLPADSATPGKGSTLLDIDRVEGTVTVVIGHETLTGVVSARSPATERGAALAA